MYLNVILRKLKMDPLDLKFHQNYIAFYKNKEEYYSDATPRLFEINFSNLNPKDEIKPNKNKQYFISLPIEEKSEIAIWSEFRDDDGPFRIMSNEYSRRLFPLEHMYFRFFRHRVEFRATDDQGEKIVEKVDFGITESCLDKATRPQSQNIEELIVIKKCQHQKKYNMLSKLMIPVSKAALNELCNNSSILFKKTNVYYYLTTIFAMFEKFMEESELYYPFYYNDSLNLSSRRNLPKFSISFEILYRNSHSVANSYVLASDIPVKKKIGTNDKSSISLFSSIVPLSNWFHISFKPTFYVRDHMLNGSTVIVLTNRNNDKVQLDFLKWFQSMYVQYEKLYDKKPYHTFHEVKKMFFHVSEEKEKDDDETIKKYLNFMKKTYKIHLHLNVHSRRPQSEI